MHCKEALGIVAQAELREILDYDERTGILKWRRGVSTGNGALRLKPGDEAGCLAPDGCIKVGINKRSYQAHRLIWMYVYGRWPKKHIDHINGIRCDNRLINLREAQVSQNLANSRLRTNNTSGFKGVTWAQHAKKWAAQISVDGKNRRIGYFSTPEAAHAAYMGEARKAFGDFARSA